MGIGIEGLKKRVFAWSPSVVKINMADAFPLGATGRRIHLRVQCTYQGNATSHEFLMEHTDDSVFFDISSALRAAMFKRDCVSMYESAISRMLGEDSHGNVITSTATQFGKDRAEFSVHAYVSYTLDGVYNVGVYYNDTGKFDRGGYYQLGGGFAYFGGLSELERIYGSSPLDSIGDVCLSKKPKSGEVAMDNHIYVVPMITQDGIPALYTFVRGMAYNSRRDVAIKITDDLTRNVYVSPSSEFVEFLFVNRLGGLEDASAVTHESLGYEMSKKTFENISGLSEKPKEVSLRSICSNFRAKWEMSSGNVNKEWAEWWAGEFLTAERHWMRITKTRLPISMEPFSKVGETPQNQIWVPVVVMPKGDSVTVYESSEGAALHVDFTVQLAYEGRV